MSGGKSNAGTSKRKTVKVEEYDEYPREAKSASSSRYICDNRTPSRSPTRHPDEVNPEFAENASSSNCNNPGQVLNEEVVEEVYENGELLNLEGENANFEYQMEPTYINPPGNDVEIEVRGVKYKIPYAINCHLCCDLMNLCIRRTRYRGQNKEYPAYRCNRKGCQTFRSVKKVFNIWKNENDIRFPTTTLNVVNIKSDSDKAAVLSDVPLSGTGSTSAPAPEFKAQAQAPEPVEYEDEELEEDLEEVIDQDRNDDQDFLVQRVNIPRYARTFDESLKPMTMTDRMKRANQERAMAFSEFSDQLRRDIAANKRIKVKRHRLDEDDEQGTLLYISKELTAHETVQLQDAVSKILMSMKKIPTPMSVHDLPLFANCPWSKEQVERGLTSDKSLEAFCTAFTKAPQPPIPEGFIRRKDDMLVYRDPEPFEVPEILRENSPRKTAASIVNYQLRKDAQEAKKYEKRFSERRYRAWKTLKRDFDSVEAAASSTPSQYTKHEVDAAQDMAEVEELRRRSVTLQHLMERMEQKDAMRSKIRRGNDVIDGNQKKRGPLPAKMKWLDGGGKPKLAKNALSSEYEKKTAEMSSISLREMMLKSLLKPSSLMERQHPEMVPEGYSDSNNNKNSQQVYAGYQQFQGHPAGYFVNPYANQQVFNQSQSSGESSSSQPQNFGNVNGGYHFMQPPPQAVGQETMDPHYLSQFTYVNPHSGLPVTDPSSFLTSFIPSPLIKNAPVTFGQPEEETKKSVVEPEAKVPIASNPYAAGEEVIIKIDERMSNEVPMTETIVTTSVSSEELKMSDASLNYDPSPVVQ